MPSAIKNTWTLKKLVQTTYVHKRNRFKNMERDVLKSIKIKEVVEYDLSSRTKRTKFLIETSSYPQYHPYFTKKDDRGRDRQFQRTYKHQYTVTIQLDRLSINVPVKLRTGSDMKWDFTESGKSKKDENSGRIREGSNIQRGLNGDFFFRLEYIYQQERILFGRNWTNGPPTKTNPKGIVFLDKHMLRAVEVLMNKGILKDD